MDTFTVILLDQIAEAITASVFQPTLDIKLNVMIRTK